MSSRRKPYPDHLFPRLIYWREGRGRGFCDILTRCIGVPEALRITPQVRANAQRIRPWP